MPIRIAVSKFKFRDDDRDPNWGTEDRETDINYFDRKPAHQCCTVVRKWNGGWDGNGAAYRIVTPTEAEHVSAGLPYPLPSEYVAARISKRRPWHGAFEYSAFIVLLTKRRAKARMLDCATDNDIERLLFDGAEPRGETKFWVRPVNVGVTQ